MTLLAEPPRISITATEPLAFNHHWKQARFELSKARINVVAKGRRSGGTQIGKRRGVRFAMANSFWPDFRVIFGAPTHQQAKDIWWDDLKRMLHRRQWEDVKVIQDKSDSELRLRLINGSIIKVAGLDKPERIEGASANVIIVTEAPNCKEVAIVQNVMPMLSERQGILDLEGAPEGRNFFYRLSCKAQEEEFWDWAFHHWTSAEVMPLYMGEEAAQAELLAARDRMDEQTYRQEYEAAFIHFEGRAYYNFDRKTHSTKRLHYDPDAPLHLAFDFNVEPGTAVIIQEEREQTHDEREDKTLVIGSVTIPRNSTTPAVCRKIVEDWGNHKGEVYLYGDATGGARGTAKVAGSDWDIIREILGHTWGIHVHMRVPRGSPRERARINAMNSRLMSSTGKARLFIDPSTAADVATDLDETAVVRGSAGEIDKKSNPDRTHHTDALGYYMIRQHPVGGQTKMRHQAI